jgi:hypothetical protein
MQYLYIQNEMLLCKQMPPENGLLISLMTKPIFKGSHDLYHRRGIHQRNVHLKYQSHNMPFKNNTLG